MVRFGIDKFGSPWVHGNNETDHLQLGRCETGSYIDTMRNTLYDELTSKEFFADPKTRSLTPAGFPTLRIEKRGGDKWSLIFPWHGNSSIKGLVNVKRTAYHQPEDLKMISCESKVRGAPIGSLYPIRGTNVMIKMGKTIGAIELRGNRIRETINGIKPVNDMFTYRATFYGSEITNDNPNPIIGYADILPNIVFLSDQQNELDFRGFRAVPSTGLEWMNEILVTKLDSEACLNGDFAPWSPDIPALLETLIYELQVM